ncbi:MAG: hypothetical protein JXB32_22395 [Deltaproteobacteria bacterium]|nr:hypothetical protein [Deltaproteobacteria bacterium]
MRRIAFAAVVALALGAAAFAAQTTGTVTEPETGKTFETSHAFGGNAHTLIGVGAFEAFGAIDVYGAGFYVDTEASARSWQRFLERQGASFVHDGVVDWGGLKSSSTLYQWVHSGSFGKGIHIKMVRSVTKQQVIDLHNDVMSALVDDFDVAVTRSPLKDYVDATCQDSEDGDELQIWSRGSTIYVKSSRHGETRIENASSIIRPVWQLWFGANPIQVPLRRELVEHLENLGGPTAAAE